MSSTIVLKAVGLNISPNLLDLPPGSLLDASNVIIRQEGVIEPRRGFPLYGNAMGASDIRAKQLLSYKNTLIRHFSSTLEFDDSNGNFSPFAGSYAEAQSGLRMKSIESNGNFYLTTSDGIKKLSAMSANQFTTAAGFITQAGGIKAIDFTAMAIPATGTQVGFLPQNSTVGYRIVWGTKDVNNNLILGAPSQFVAVYSPITELLVPDYLQVLEALNNINPNSSTFFRFGNYVNTFKVPIDATPAQIGTQAVLLATQIDNDIIYAGAGAPLTASSAAISAGTCTITFSSGNPISYLSVGSKIFLSGFTPGTSGTLDGAQIVTARTSTTLSFATTATGTVTISGGYSIVSNQYRSITTPLTPSSPATGDQLISLQDYILNIITGLQGEPSTIISTPFQTAFISPLGITTSSNVKLIISIPDGITTNYFVQVYRSTIKTATGVTVLSDLVPDDELQLVYEAYPTSAEITAKQMIVVDIGGFPGANLYTNASTGEGILQANDVPPFATDINRFKNVIFYANSKTRHRIVPFNLLGVSNLLTDFNNGIIPRITISNGAVTNTYSFIEGVAQETYVDVLAKAGISASAYFNINSANDINKYYVWYDTTGSDPDPTVAGRIGIKINISTLVTSTQVAAVTRDIMSQFVNDFNITSSSNRVDITNVDVGYTTSPTAQTSGFTLTVHISGKGESVANKQILLSTAVSVAQAVQETALSLIKVINENSNETIYSYYVSSSASIPGKMVLESRGLSNVPFYIIANNTNTGSSFFPDISPEKVISANGAITVANPTTLTSVAHGLNNTDQILITNSNSTPSIDGIYTVTVTGVDTFTIPVNVTAVATPSKFSYSLLADATSSQNEVKVNRIYYSKVQQPEAVPATNFLDIGAQDKAILRIFPLRDSLFVFKEDGLFRISGELAPFYVSLFDSSCLLRAADSVAVANNLIYCYTKQGISTVSEAGVETVSRPIDTEILKFPSDSYTNFSTATFGVGYESDNSYIVWTINKTDATIANIAYRYSNLTKTWTTFNKTNTCGIVNPSNDRLYLGAGDINFLEKERKSFTRLDYADREYNDNITVDAYSGNNIMFDNVTNYAVGDVINQDQLITPYIYNMLLKKLDIDPSVAAVNITNITQAGLTLTITAPNHNLVNNDYVTILNNTSVPQINATYVATYIDANTFSIDTLIPVLTLAITGQARLNYFNSLRASAGNDMRSKIVALAHKLDTDPGLVNTNYYSSIAPKTGSITTISKANPTIITSTAHGLISNRLVSISGSNSTPSINGNNIVTVLSSNTFSIPINVNTAGTTGSFVTLDETFADIQANYNFIISNLNADAGAAFSNYQPSTITTSIEAVITTVDKNTKTITLNQILDYIVGPVTIFKAISSTITYAPVTMGDTLGLKHLREATMMFENKAFTKATLSFSTDLLPEFIPTDFKGDGPGIFGSNNFGNNFFGGNSHGVPFRTYIPRNCQRCRYIVTKFTHDIAREKYYIFGITITGEVGQSTRAYR